MELHKTILTIARAARKRSGSTSSAAEAESEQTLDSFVQATTSRREDIPACLALPAS